jgi:transaldolase
MSNIDQLKIKLFADGADLAQISRLAADPRIKGFTTNPTLMRKAGIADYAAFARDALRIVAPRPISFEVFADDLPEMKRQARIISGWGENVFVKLPITNTKRESTAPLVTELSAQGVRVNVTAILTLDQVKEMAIALDVKTPSNVSIFAGRIADTGRDPVPLVAEARKILSGKPNVEIIWASPRELLNIWHADGAGCHIITVTSDILGKLALYGKDLGAYSLDTVRMFHDDAKSAGYILN